MSKWIAIFISGLIFFITGCEDKAKSVDWYMEHPNELAVVFKDCKVSGDDTPNCRNAKDANFRLKQRDAKIPTFGDLSSDKE